MQTSDFTIIAAIGALVLIGFIMPLFRKDYPSKFYALKLSLGALLWIPVMLFMVGITLLGVTLVPGLINTLIYQRGMDQYLIFSLKVIDLAVLTYMGLIILVLSFIASKLYKLDYTFLDAREKEYATQKRGKVYQSIKRFFSIFGGKK